jgi:hypothetical protein
MSLLLVLFLQVTATANQKQEVFKAARHFMPGITWQQDSVLIADFSCRGHREQAILGTHHPDTASPYAIVAVFLDRLNKQPEFITDSVHVPADAKLTLESLDYDPEDEIGSSIPGFKRSKVCIGLNVADDHTDSLHIYWNHYFRGFGFWRR